MSEMLKAQTAALSEAEQSFVAWVTLNFARGVVEDVASLLKKEHKGFANISTVDEHRIRQEARNRGISLPR